MDFSWNILRIFAWCSIHRSLHRNYPMGQTMVINCYYFKISWNPAENLPIHFACTTDLCLCSWMRHPLLCASGRGHSPTPSPVNVRTDKLVLRAWHALLSRYQLTFPPFLPMLVWTGLCCFHLNFDRILALQPRLHRLRLIDNIQNKQKRDAP